MPTLSLRKIIRFGKQGFVITIPSGWARYYGLKPGDVVEVLANGELKIRVHKIGIKNGELVIHPERINNDQQPQ